MLGFSPLASGPLATTGKTNFPLSANLITTGSSIVDASIIAQKHDLSLDAITTALPIVPAVTMAEDETLAADLIVTGQPVVSAASVQIVFVITADGITTGAPVIGQAALNASKRRAVHVSDPSQNLAVVTLGSNSCIVSKNTPNIVVVTDANEAA